MTKTVDLLPVTPEDNVRGIKNATAVGLAGLFAMSFALAVSPIDSVQADDAEVAEFEAHFDSFKDHLAPMVVDHGDNLAYTEAASTIHPEQTAFARQMGRGIYMPVEDTV